MEIGRILKTVGKGLLAFVPGGGAVVAGLELAGAVAEAVGGETGKKINEGLNQVAEGLSEAGSNPLSPEQQAKLQEAGMKHKEQMAALDLEDIQGGRDLAKTEIASQDEYVRHTRPELLRWYGKGSFILVFACVGVVFVSAFSSAVDKEEAAFIVDVLKWAFPTLSGTFLVMYRAYVGKRTAEKLAEHGVTPEGLLDKLARLKNGGTNLKQGEKR